MTGVFMGQFGAGFEVRFTPHVGWTNDISYNDVEGGDNDFIHGSHWSELRVLSREKSKFKERREHCMCSRRFCFQDEAVRDLRERSAPGSAGT